MTRFLIAGLGSIGRRHLRNLIALGEEDIVLLRSHRSTLPDDELAGFPVENDITEALARHRPAGVIVANPTSLHLDVAIPAAEAGCAILLEKPISDSMDRVGALQEAVRRTQAPVLVGFQLRYHPALLRTHQLISEGKLGRVLSSRAHFGEYLPGWHPWEDYRQGYAARADLGGGVLLTQCHSLDYLPWLVGEVDSVWGFLGQLSDLELDVEDTAEIGVRFVNGSLGSLHLDYSQQPPSHELEITGTSGRLLCDLMTGTTRFHPASEKRWIEDSLPRSWERNALFVAEMQHFLDVVHGKAKPACALDDGVRVMKLIGAVQTANRTGKVVNLRS